MIEAASALLSVHVRLESPAAALGPILTAFDRSPDRHPSDPEASALLARANKHVGGDEKVIPLLRSEVLYNPGSFSRRFALGRALASAGNHSAAAVAFSTCLVLRARDASSARELAVSELHLGRRDSAIRTLETTVRNVATDHVAHYLLGVSYGESGNNVRAARHLEAALALKTDSHETLFHLARAYERLNDYPRALRCMEEAAALAPDDETYREALRAVSAHAAA